MEMNKLGILAGAVVLIGIVAGISYQTYQLNETCEY